VLKLCWQNAAILIFAEGGTYIYHRYLTAQQDYGYKNDLYMSFTECNVAQSQTKPFVVNTTIEVKI
jgi:hypothetical protein